MEVLDIRPLSNWRQALSVRWIRNQCCEFMTIDTNKIGIIDQLKWYYRFYLPQKKTGELIVYLLYLHNKPIGYGLIRGRTTRPIISGGLVNKCRGLGFGKKLFAYLAREASRMDGRIGRRSVFLEVRATNKAAVHVYTGLGFVEKSRLGDIITMQRDYGEFDHV